MFRGNNRARQGATVHGAPSGQIVTTGDAVVGGRCDYSAPTDATDGYYKLCLDAANGKIVYGGTKTPAGGLSLEINGTTYPIPGAGNGDTSGPSASIDGGIAVFNGTTGKLIRDTHIAYPASPSLTNVGKMNVGGFPEASQIPSPVVQGMSVMVAVPASATNAPWPNTGISSYITNANPTTESSVASLFGFAGQTANNGGASFGLNVIAANCAAVNCPYGSGFSTGTIVGAEIDLNQRKTGTTTPVGQAVGLFVTGDSESIPANGSYAVKVKHFGIGLNVPWLVGFQTDDGAAQTGITVGALNTTGASDSQYLTWKGNSGAAPIFMAVQLLQDHFLNFIDSPTPGTGGIRAQHVDASLSYQLAGTTLATFAATCMNVVNGTGPSMRMCGTPANTVYRNALHQFQSVDGLQTFAVFQPIAGPGSTGMVLQVNNASGAALQQVTLGAADSAGPGFKVLRVPN
jgi:hypothetical protein